MEELKHETVQPGTLFCSACVGDYIARHLEQSILRSSRHVLSFSHSLHLHFKTEWHFKQERHPWKGSTLKVDLCPILSPNT